MGEVKKCEKLGCTKDAAERRSYCSHECQVWMKNYRRSVRAQQAESERAVPEQRECAYEQCKQLFTPDYRKLDQKCCCTRCTKAMWDAEHRRKKAEQPKAPRVTWSIRTGAGDKPVAELKVVSKVAPKRPDWMVKVLRIHRPELLEMSHE